MKKIQAIKSLSITPRISIFDKKGQANFARLNNKINSTTNQNQNAVNLPQFRINQHKGA